MFTINLSNFTKCDVFTPSIISQQMSSFLSLSGTLLEPACGEGHLLTHLDLSNYDCVDLYDIKSEYLDKCPRIVQTYIDIVMILLLLRLKEKHMIILL